MNLVEFCNSHKKWCKEVGRKSCKRTQLRLEPDHSSDTCKICLANYLPKVMEYEHAEDNVLKTGVAAIFHPRFQRLKVEVPDIPKPTAAQVALGIQELVNEIRTLKAEKKYNAGDQFVIGDLSLELIDFNSAHHDEPNCTFRILHHSYPLRSFTGASSSADVDEISWEKIWEYLNTTYKAGLPVPLQEAILPVTVETNVAVKDDDGQWGFETRVLESHVWIPSEENVGCGNLPVGARVLDIFNESEVGAYSPFARAVYNNIGDDREIIQWATRSLAIRENEVQVGVITKLGHLEYVPVADNAFFITPFVTLG